MIKQYLYRLLFTFSILSLLSCEKELNLTLDSATGQLVVEGYIESEQYPIVYLSETIGLFGSVDIKSLAEVNVSDANVWIANNNNDTMPLVAYPIGIFGNDTLHVYTVDESHPLVEKFIGKENNTYHLIIDWKDQQYTASTTIPEKNNHVDSIWSEIITNENALAIDSSFRFVKARYSDPVDKKNYIRIQTKRNNEQYQSPFFSVISDDLFNGVPTFFSIDRGYNKSLGRDDDESDTSRYNSRYYNVGDTVYLKWCSIDENTYNFYRTLEYSYSSTGNPFAAPLNVLTNISNGALGVWAGYGVVEYQYIIQD